VSHIIQFLIQHGYLLLFAWLLVEQAAVPLPSIPLLLACGALARDGKMAVHLILLYGLAACLIADNIWFQLGRRRGTKILRFICRIALEPDSCVRQTENAFLKYGMRSLLVAKFVPGLNAVAAPLAGRSGASRGRFLLFDSLGILLWVATFTGVGYIFSDQLEDVANYAMRMGSGLGVLIVGLLATWIAWKFVQRQRFLRKLAVSRITAEELRSKLVSGEDLLILDVRGPLDDDPNPIPGAMLISVEELAKRYMEIPKDRDLILVCN
jgi:membrane protein DedA with SNARE-associated domain